MRVLVDNAVFPGTLPFRVNPRMGATEPPKSEKDMMSEEQRSVLKWCLEVPTGMELRLLC